MGTRSRTQTRSPSPPPSQSPRDAGDTRAPQPQRPNATLAQQLQRSVSPDSPQFAKESERPPERPPTLQLQRTLSPDGPDGRPTKKKTSRRVRVSQVADDDVPIQQDSTLTDGSKTPPDGARTPRSDTSTPPPVNPEASTQGGAASTGAAGHAPAKAGDSSYTFTTRGAGDPPA